MIVTFWGVRGSIACPSPQYMAYGGNTSCVQLEVGGHHLVFDAGTGIRALGNMMMKGDVRQAILLFSHTHWDHIHGFPFFAPAFRSERSFRVLAGHLSQSGGVRATLSGQMTQPMFPVPLEAMRADLAFEDFQAGESFSLPGSIRVLTTTLNHPNGATGYRIEHGGRSFCYVTDTEHLLGRHDDNILGLIEGADLVVYDSTYTDDEWRSKIGWGHSTWQEGVRLAKLAHVRRLALFHHDPDHDDDFMNRVERQAVESWSGALVAREGMSLVVGEG